MSKVCMDDYELEQEIRASFAAPTVTIEQIEAAIETTFYFTAGNGVDGAQFGRTRVSVPHGALDRLTFCVLLLKNGFTVVGKSACVSAKNFDAEKGRSLAREDAIRQCWALFGFQLATDLAGGRITAPA